MSFRLRGKRIALTLGAKAEETMLGTSRKVGRLFLKRTIASAAFSNGQTDPLTLAAFQFMADTAKSNTEDRKRSDDKCDRALEKFSSSLESFKEGLKADITSIKEGLDSLKSDFTSLKTDVSTLKTDFTSSHDSLKSDVTSLKTDVSSLKTDYHSLDKKVTIIIAVPSLLLSLVTVAGVANRYGLLAATAPVVSKSVEAVASTPWFWF